MVWTSEDQLNKDCDLYLDNIDHSECKAEEDYAEWKLEQEAIDKHLETISENK